MQLYLFGADLGDVDMEVADRIGPERLLVRLVAGDIRQPLDAMALKTAV